MSLTLEIARRALDASRARAREFGCQVSIALVDSAGHLVAFERMMAPYAWATAGIATAKATSAVMFNQSTSDISRWAGDIPGFATSMASMTQGKFIMAPGGWPIRGPNGVTVGAIGISGGNAPGRDDDIARAGVYAAEAALQADFQRRMQAQAAAQAPAPQPVPAAAPAAPAFPAPAQPQAAPATVELAHSEPAASVYMPVVTPESVQNSSATPANSQTNSEDDQPTITAEPQR
ncbi:MAG TPA: heme-binding protein [Ktedonobacterales bacterium]|nr:heme-binding protein [Ktedonobacterales bacterium]